MTTTLTPAGLSVLRDAAARKTGYVCPTYGLRAAVQTSVLRRLRDAGYIADESRGVPMITQAGRDALAEHYSESPVAPAKGESGKGQETCTCEWSEDGPVADHLSWCPHADSASAAVSRKGEGKSNE